MTNYGSGSIKQRAEGSFQLRWYNQALGKYQTKTVRGTISEAKKALKIIQADLVKGTYRTPAKMTIKELIEKYLAEFASGKSGKTYERYTEQCINHLIPKLGHFRVDELKPNDVSQFLKELLKSGRVDGKGGLSPKSAHHMRAVLRAIINWGKDSGTVSPHIINPVNRTNAVSQSERPKMEILTPEEINKLLETSKDSSAWGMATIVALLTGARQGEILALTWDDVDWEAMELTINKSLESLKGKYTVKDTKTGEDRVLPIEGRLIEALKRYREIQNGYKQEWGRAYDAKNLICCRADGSYIYGGGLSTGFRQLCKTAGVKQVRFHDCRHTHITHLLQTQPVHIVSERAGHKNPIVTLTIYAHVMPTNKRNASKAFEEMLDAAEVNTTDKTEE